VPLRPACGQLRGVRVDDRRDRPARHRVHRGAQPGCDIRGDGPCATPVTAPPVYHPSAAARAVRDHADGRPFPIARCFEWPSHALSAWTATIGATCSAGPGVGADAVKATCGAVADGIGAVTAVALTLSRWPMLPSGGRHEAGRRPAHALATAPALGEVRQCIEPLVTICRFMITKCVRLGEPERWGQQLDRERNAMLDTWT
jgi:hypothetical protein